MELNIDLFVCLLGASKCLIWQNVTADNGMFYRGKWLAKKYYDKLFKEYCIADLSQYKENKVHISDILLNTCCVYLSDLVGLMLHS